MKMQGILSLKKRKKKKNRVWTQGQDGTGQTPGCHQGFLSVSGPQDRLHHSLSIDF